MKCDDDFKTCNTRTRQTIIENKVFCYKVQKLYYRNPKLNKTEKLTMPYEWLVSERGNTTSSNPSFDYTSGNLLEFISTSFVRLKHCAPP